MQRSLSCAIALGVVGVITAGVCRADVVAWSRQVTVYNLVEPAVDPISAWSRQVSVWRNPCRVDFDLDGFATGDDFDAFANAFIAGDDAADFDGNGFVNGDDYDAFVESFIQGC